MRFPTITSAYFQHRDEAFVIGLVVIPLAFEALRRTAGWPLVFILAAFFVYALWGDSVPGVLQARSPGFYRLVAYLTGDSVALLGVVLNIIVTVVVMFVIMGQLLATSGGSAWFTDLAMSMFGKRRGGPAKIAVAASALFGSISGSAVANVASTGVVTIPLMRRAGYSAASAGAFEAVASTGGQIMPPVMGAAGFLMAEFLQISYAEVILAALVPSLLYYFAVFIQADLEAARRGLKALADDEVAPLGQVLRRGWLFVLPFALLLVALFSFNRTASEAALWATASLLVVGLRGYKGHRLTPRKLIEDMHAAGRTAAPIIVVGAMAGMIIGIVEVTGLGFGLTYVLVSVGEKSLLLLLLLTAVVAIILGMGMPTTAIYFLLAVLAAPPLVKLGVEPLAAHLFILYFGLLSMITPPVALAAFTAAGLSGARPMETAVMSVRYGWPAFALPFVFVLTPGLILAGSLPDIARTVSFTFLGVWFATVGIGGYFRGEMARAPRFALITGGLLLVFPNAYFGVRWLDVVGAAIAAAGLLLCRRTRPRVAPTRQ
ncbi:MAG: TRAP transporter fused permease subunit [Burkholderiales bacterium]|nr:TRAP transporter fused permease subunit [Burkholderiales bacterium]